MFVYNKQKSQRDKELKSRIDNAEISRNRCESKIRSEYENRKRVNIEQNLYASLNDKESEK